MASIVNTHEAKTHLSRLLDRVQAGEEIIIARAGRPIARLTSIDETALRRPGSARGLVVVPDTFDDPLDDFDALG